MEFSIALRYFRRGGVRLRKTKEREEKGAEDGEGDENEAEGLFGACPFDDNDFIPSEIS